MSSSSIVVLLAVLVVSVRERAASMPDQMELCSTVVYAEGPADFADVLDKALHVFTRGSYDGSHGS